MSEIAMALPKIASLDLLDLHEFPFTDLEPTYDGGMAYNCPNEDANAWRELIKGRRINRAAAICSGGEIGLWALLPTVKKELVLIDHSYRPLGFAMAKFMLIQKVGYEKAAAILRNIRTWGDLDEHLGDGWKERLPNKVRIGFVALDCYTISHYWRKLSVGRGHTAEKASAIVRFVHGDMRHLEGEFDLFYVSNAFDSHNGNRAKYDELVKAVDSKVKIGGLICVAGLRKEFQPLNWTLVVQKQGGRDYGWNNAIYRKTGEFKARPLPKGYGHYDF